MGMTTTDGISYDKAAGERVFDLGDGLLVGRVLRSRIHQRRDNFRMMNPQQRAGLTAAVDRLGFKSLLTVSVEDDGTFGIVDGHHRIEEADARQMILIPVVFLKASKLDTDMGMISFNISADTKAREFNDFMLQLLKDNAPTDELAHISGVSPEYLEMLMSQSAPPDLNAGVNPEEVIVQRPTKTKGKRRYVILYDSARSRVVGGIHSLPGDFVVSRSLQDLADFSGLLISEVPMVEAESESDLSEAMTSYTSRDD